VLEDSLYRFDRLTHLNLGTLATNAILKAVSETCTELKELRLCGGGGGHQCSQNKVGDLGLRYLAGLIPTVGHRKPGEKERVISVLYVYSKVTKSFLPDVSSSVPTTAKTGCFKLRVLSLLDVEKVSLHTLTLLLLHLPELRVLDHNQLHEALRLMHKSGMEDHLLQLKVIYMITIYFPKILPYVSTPQLSGYNGRGPSQCWPEVLDVIRTLCPKMENLHLCTTFDDTVIALAKFRNIKTLSIFRSETYSIPIRLFVLVWTQFLWLLCMYVVASCTKS
jgi:hypothetical protein